MIMRKFLVPLVTHDTDFSIKSIEDTIDVQIKNDSRDVENLSNTLDNLYSAVFKKVIEYEKIHHYLVYIYEYLLEAENSVNNDLFIRFLFEIELLVQNYYYRLRQRLINDDLYNTFGLSLINIEYPIYKVSKHINLQVLIDRICDNKTACRNDISDLIFGYLILKGDDKSREYFVGECRQRMLLNFIFNYKKNSLFEEFFLYDCEVFQLNKFYLDDIDKKLFIEKCFESDIIRIQQQIINQSKSHFYIDLYFKYLIQNIEFERLFLNTSVIDDPHTYSVVHKLLEYNSNIAEHILKKLILKHREKRYKNIFFDKCTNIDPDFVEICIWYMESVSSLDQKLFKRIVLSKYFPYFAREMNIYKDSIARLPSCKLKPKNMYHIIANLFSDAKHDNEKFYHKMLCFFETFSEYKPKLSIYFVKAFRHSYDRSICKCKVNTSEDLVSQVSAITFSNPIENSTMYKLVDCFRDQSIIQENLTRFIECNFTGFVDHCFSSKNFCMDTMLLQTFKYLRSRGNDISSSALYSNHIKHLKKTKTNSIYWDIILKKNINQLQVHNLKAFSNHDIKTMIDYLYDYKMLVDTLIKTLNCPKIDYEVVEKILHRLEDDNKFANGLTLFDSNINFTTSAKSFCLYGIFHQYDMKDEQELVRLQGENFTFTLSLKNGNLIKTTVLKSITETFLINNEVINDKKINLGIRYVREKLKIYYNASKYETEVQTCEKVTVGARFRGVIKELLWHENSKFNHKFFTTSNDHCVHNKFILDLEKILTFQNDCGFYLHRIQPYFFGHKTEVKLEGILINKNIAWIENVKLRELFYDRMTTDDRLLELFDKYIPGVLSTLMHQ